MKTPTGFDARSLRRLNRRKAANESVPVLDAELDAPALALLLPANASKSALVSGGRLVLVLQVERTRDVTEVVDPVIRSNAVPVVHVIGRPNAVHVEPGETVSPIAAPVDAHADIARLSITRGAR